MSRYFDLFPRIRYDIAKAQYSSYQLTTNIFFRMGILRKALDNITAFYTYSIKDNDTPEIIAEKIYGSAEAHWIILYAKNIVDPQYDWPLKTDDFNKYIADKYRSQAGGSTLTDQQVVAWSQKVNDPTANNIHHYERVEQQLETSTNTLTTTRYIIDYDAQSDVGYIPDVPYVYYTDGTMAIEPSNGVPITINGKTVITSNNKAFVTIYDHEEELNEAKRDIKIIKPDYYVQIMSEFQSMLSEDIKGVRGIS